MPLDGGEGNRGLVDLDLGIRTQERQRLVEKSLAVFLLEDCGRQGPWGGGRSGEAVDSSMSRRGSPLSLTLSLVPLLPIFSKFSSATPVLHTVYGGGGKQGI